MLRKLLLTGAASAALAIVGTAAHADNIVTNTWYTGHFTNTGTPLLAGSFSGGLGTNGPILPNPTKQPTALPAPGTAGGALSAVITLPSGGYLLVTDVEISGDQFEMSVNGMPAIAAPAGATGLIPGGQQAIGPLTSAPNANASNVGEDISAALANADFSSGTFYLPPGVDTITGLFLGTIRNGDMNLIVEPVAEPAELAVLGVGLLGLGLALRRRRG